MKRSHDQIISSSEEQNRKVRVTSSQVTITLDQSIGSNLLNDKFRIQTTELQLFLQQVPVLYWYPIQLIGSSNFTYNIDECIIRAAVLNPLHQFSTMELIEKMLSINNRWSEARELLLIHLLNIDEMLENRKVCTLMKSLLEDEEFILHLTRTIHCKRNVHLYVSDRLENNEEFFLKVYKQYTDRYRANQNNCDIVCEELIRNNCLEQVKQDTFKDNEEIVLKAVKQDGEALKYASERLKDNDQIVLEAVKQNGEALEYASDRLQDNELIVLEAVTKYDKALKYASDRLRDNEQFVLQVVNQNGYALYSASKRFQENEIFILEAIKQNGLALSYASERFQDNDQIILEAVKQNGEALYSASKRLKDNYEIVLQAVKENGYSLRYASNRLQNDEAIVLEAVSTALSKAYDRLKESEQLQPQQMLALYYASERLKDNEEIVLEALKQNSDALKIASKRLKDNETIVLEAVKQNGLAIKYASDRLQDDEQIVLEAVKQNSNALKFASDRLRNDFNFANQIFKSCNSLNIFEVIGEELRSIEFIYYFIENYRVFIDNYHSVMMKILI